MRLFSCWWFWFSSSQLNFFTGLLDGVTMLRYSIPNAACYMFCQLTNKPTSSNLLILGLVIGRMLWLSFSKRDCIVVFCCYIYYISVHCSHGCDCVTVYNASRRLFLTTRTGYPLRQDGTYWPILCWHAVKHHSVNPSINLINSILTIASTNSPLSWVILRCFMLRSMTADCSIDFFVSGGLYLEICM